MLELDPILLSRIQFAFTLSFHILFPALTIGLSIYLAIWEMMWLKTRKPVYVMLCKFWSKIFALGFGLGIVSGIVLSYEFGTNFSRFSQITGNVLGPLMSYEVLTAFFLEAGFLGIMLFGWNRVSEKVHMIATITVAIGATFSAFWILSANSWMHTPSGYRLENGIFYVTNWWKVVFNPSFPYRFLHMIIASYLAVTILLAGIAAAYLYSQKHLDSAKAIFSLTLAVSLVLAPLQILLGDLHGLNTLKHQPIKVAAMEGHWETLRSAPLILFAVPDIKTEQNLYAISMPKLGSLILRHDLNGEVLGLKTVAKKDRPYVPVVFYSFRIMVAIGFIFLLTALTGLYLRLRHSLYDNKYFLIHCLAISPLGFIAILAGWFTTEVGRQPWIVYGLLRTQDAVSLIDKSSLILSLSGFILLYSSLLAVFLFYFIRLIKKGPEAVTTQDKPDKFSPWLEEKP
jgi:cytochrome bd ubiquinol oxidase subunit I